MHFPKLTLTAIFLLFTASLQTPIFAASESEPNDTSATATLLRSDQTMEGAISPDGDKDFYLIKGVNTTWGFIALLDTSSSTGSMDGVITALGNDGATVLQTDNGSWEKGAGIALQSYADGGLDHYLLVNERNDDDSIAPYTLRYFKTIVNTRPEVEPNNGMATATPSAFTMAGVIDSASDVDYFAFHGRLGDDLVFALNADPEKDGSAADFVLTLLDPAGTTLKTVNFSGAGGNEFMEYSDLPAEGAYFFSVSAVSGSGTDATYHAGLVRNDELYKPALVLAVTWLNAPADGTATVGDLMKFRLTVENQSPVDLPGDILIRATFPENCLEFVSADPPETEATTGEVNWAGQKTGLAAGETDAVEVTMRAAAVCTDVFGQSTSFDYIFTGIAADAPFQIDDGEDDTADDDDDDADDGGGGGGGGGCFLSSLQGKQPM